MSKVLCIDTNELYDLINSGYSVEDLQQMSLEQLEQMRPLDTEDMRYIEETECRECPKNNNCGEFNRK